ncbi:hypothetical protein TRIATDRAFT_53935 [Trichoderma atroviride IMI 206040]|uniref:Uncharacterized protein n=1 Tax=Hypocrea atroviridis (strain ATCC 20476 / IMI 206040) TaxID=452589 RepID=G9NKY0_HYPAI|nr:uncharacterized protein TRIATDRAFT_53935 [Trichoderma atroviride IMI 206040]EHK48550.1 hypothetical protein TRIATDRAFT_53935 [Trichoderma atroviride IMI 206040]
MPRDLAKSVRHCSADNPFPVVIPLERPNVAGRIQSLRSQRHKLLIMKPSPAKTDQLNVFYSSLMDAVCSLVGVDGSRYPKCVDVCITMCKDTNVYEATSWKRWVGLRIFNTMMKDVRRLTRETKVIHCPAAPLLMVVIAIKELLPDAKKGHERNIMGFLREFDCYSKAASAICYFHKGDRQKILALDQPWVLNTSVQRPPTRLIDQFEFTTSPGHSGGTRLVPKDSDSTDVEMKEDPTPIKIESSPECETEPASEHQTTPHAIQQTGLALAGQATASRERRHEVPMALSMPRHEPPTQQGTYLQVTRAEVMEYLQPLFNRLKYEDWVGRLHDDIMCILTEKSVKVITAEAKGMLGLWAGKTQNGTVLTWLEQAKEDLTVFRWVERNEPSSATLWYTDHIHTIFHDINVTIGAVSEPTVQEELRAQVGALRDIIFAINK